MTLCHRRHPVPVADRGRGGGQGPPRSRRACAIGGARSRSVFTHRRHGGDRRSRGRGGQWTWSSGVGHGRGRASGADAVALRQRGAARRRPVVGLALLHRLRGSRRLHRETPGEGGRAHHLDLADAGRGRGISGSGARRAVRGGRARGVAPSCVRDDRDAIARGAAPPGRRSDDVRFVFTTGGHGPDRRRRDPGGHPDAIEREAPGYAETIRAESRDAHAARASSRAGCRASEGGR